MRLIVVALLALAACAQPGPQPGPGPSPWTPVDPPGPVTPPDNPPVTPPVGSGAIDEAGFAAIDEDAVGADGVVRNGTAEAAMLARLGPPYRKTLAGGLTIYVYAFNGSDSVAWFFVKSGKVVRKSRL